MGGNDDIAKYWKGTAAWMNNSIKTRTNYNKTHTHTHNDECIFYKV